MSDYRWSRIDRSRVRGNIRNTDAFEGPFSWAFF